MWLCCCLGLSVTWGSYVWSYYRLELWLSPIGLHIGGDMSLIPPQPVVDLLGCLLGMGKTGSVTVSASPLGQSVAVGLP